MQTIPLHFDCTASCSKAPTQTAPAHLNSAGVQRPVVQVSVKGLVKHIAPLPGGRHEVRRPTRLRDLRLPIVLWVHNHHHLQRTVQTEIKHGSWNTQGLHGLPFHHCGLQLDLSLGQGSMRTGTASESRVAFLRIMTTAICICLQQQNLFSAWQPMGHDNTDITIRQTS